MEIITNKLLQKFSFNYSDSLYKDNYNTSDIEQKDEQIELELKQSFYEFFIGNKELKKNYSNLPEKEQLIINKLIELRSIFEKRKEFIMEIKTQLKQCRKFICTDMCKRNNVLLNEVTLEIQRLKHVVDTDFVSVSVNLLNILYSELYPDISLKRRCVFISERMKSLYFFKEEPFYSEEEAEIIVNGDKDIHASNAETYIYQSIKQYL